MKGLRSCPVQKALLSIRERRSSTRCVEAPGCPLDAAVQTDVPVGRLFRKDDFGGRHVVVGARALLSLPSGMQLSARQEVDGWMLVAWRVPKRKGGLDAGYEYVDAPVRWRKRRFSTTDDLLAAMMRNKRIAVRS